MIVSRSEILIAIGKPAGLDAAGDARLTLLHPLVEAAIKSHLQQEFELTSRVEYLPALPSPPSTATPVPFLDGEPGPETLQLRNAPVSVVGLSVWENADAWTGQTTEGAGGNFGDEHALTIGEHFSLDVDCNGSDGNAISRTGILRRQGGCGWPREPRSVKVEYFGGFSDESLMIGMGGAVKLATLKAIIHNFRQMGSSLAGRYRSETIGKYSYSLDGSGDAFGAGMVSLPPSVLIDLQPFRRYRIY